MKTKNSKTVNEEISKLINKEKQARIKLEAQRRLNLSYKKQKVSPEYNKELLKAYNKLNKARAKEQAKRTIKRVELSQQYQNAPIRTSINQANLQMQQANKRANIIGNLYTKAERMENFGLSINELPLLHALEYERAKRCTVSNKYLINTEKSVTDSFPS
jgi:hypothetical protein